MIVTINYCFRRNYNDSNYDVKEINIISKHFPQTLLQYKFKLDSTIHEFQEPKKLLKSIWDAIFKPQSKDVKFGHILFPTGLI